MRQQMPSGTLTAVLPLPGLQLGGNCFSGTLPAAWADSAVSAPAAPGKHCIAVLAEWWACGPRGFKW